MPQTETKRRRLKPVPGSAGSRRGPENLVAEIVDQITEKQDRAAEKQTDRPREGRAFVLEPPGTPYRAVLSCSDDEPGFP